MTPAQIALAGGLALLSLAGFLRVTGGQLRAGGRVPVALYGGPELAFALFFAALFGAEAWLVFHMPIHLSSARQIQGGEIEQGVMVAGVLGYLVMRGVSLREAFGFRRCPLLRVPLYALGLLLLALPAVGFAMLIPSGFSAQPPEHQEVVNFFSSEVRQRHFDGVRAIFISAGLVAPFCEEILFRGLLYGVFKRFAGPWVSAVIAAALFALLHGSLAALGGLFLLALALTAAYEWSGSLLVPMCMHALFNTVNLLGLLLAAW